MLDMRLVDVFRQKHSLKGRFSQYRASTQLKFVRYARAQTCDIVRLYFVLYTDELNSPDSR